MNRRLIIPAAVLGLASLAACGPPVEAHVQKPVPPCTAPVTVIHEGDMLPCIPTPPQRLDVLIDLNGNLGVAVAKCNGMGGVPQGPVTDPLVCRGVTL